MRRTTLSPGPRSWRRGASARGAVLSAAVLAALAVGAPGQQKQQFAELFKQTFPDNRDRSESIAIGDVDGDGDLDMVVATRAQNRLYLNDGEGNYTDATAAKLPVSTDWTTEVVLGDVDGDGDLDMVLATYYWSTNYSGQNRLLLNDGSGGFTDVSAQQMPLLNDPTVDAALGDVDGDGDLDIVFGNAGYPGWQNRLYLNNGFGVFTDATATNLPPRGFVTLAVAFGDVDGDGDPDLIEGNFFAQSRIYLNNGAGVYADATATNFPVYSSAVADVVVGDVDGDGDQDLILAQYSNLFGNNLNLLYLNNGAGVFTDVTATQMPNLSEWTESVALGDVDGDGDLDLVCGNDYADDRLYVNNGAGFFTDATAAQMPPAHGDAQTVALGDVDGDGDLDMVIGNFTNKYATPSRLYLNDGGGKFVQTVVHRLPENVSRTTALAFGDVDGDGDLDIAVGTAATRCKYGCGGDQNQLYLNDGRGQFTDVTAGQLPSYYDETNALAFADVDGDGDLDMVVANDSGCRLLVNDGAGNFTEVTTTQLPASWQIASCVVLGDVDGDGDIDMVVGSTQGNYWYYTYGTGQTRLYVNDGRGFFRDATLTHMPLDRDDTRAVTLGDIDGDGDLDLVLGSGASYAYPNTVLPQQDRIYLNTGGGRFVDVTSSTLPQRAETTTGVAAGDVDGDGALDLVFTLASGSQPVLLYMNNGSGGFSDASTTRLPNNAGNARGVTLADIDGDGDLDLLVLAYAGKWLYLNDGLGNFTDVTAARMPAAAELSTSVALGDVDRDGDIDMLVGSGNLFSRQTRLYLNLQRQVDAPMLARTGRTYTLDVYSRTAGASQLDVALPYLSLGLASVPLPPYGVLGIDPSQAFALPPFVIPGLTGVGSVTFAVPNQPWLHGVELHAQAVIVPSPGLPGLTNVTTDAIIH